MFAGIERHVLDVVIGVIVPALRQIRRSTNVWETRNLQLGRTVVKRRPACVRETFDSQPVHNIDVAILVQTVESETAVTDARLVDKTRPDDVDPRQRDMLRPLFLVTTPPWNVSS
jgi:hypothetical protein